MAKRGRKPFKATVSLRRSVEQLVSVGESQESIARAIGCDDDTLRKHFGPELAMGLSKRRKEIVDKLYELARKGNVSAAKRVEEMTRVAGAAAAFEKQEEQPRPAKLGKKDEAAEAAISAGEGTDWGDDLRLPGSGLN